MNKKKVELLFRLKCPLGYSVHLDVDCWTDHILDGHPELARRDDDVQSTIIKPDIIFESKKANKRTLIYIRKFEGVDKYNAYLKIPVRITNEKRKIGWVRSAYPIAILGGGKKIWPPK